MVYDDARLHASWGIDIKGVDANDALKLFKEIEEENGYISPAMVVERSKEKGALLHDQFEWDDEIAGGKYREIQARGIMRNLIVSIEGNNMSSNTRGLVHVQKGYNSVDRVIKVPETRELLFKKAIEELEAFKRKYQDLLEFTKFFDEIDKLKEALA